LQHSLPTVEGKEFVQPILIDLLNYIQEKTGHRIHITCGHRCPAHNKYADPQMTHSKHLVAAEVDFFVERMEHKSEEIVALLMRYYREREEYSGQSAYTSFGLCQRNTRKLAHPGWHNKEVIIRIYQKDEGRDLDNQHPYPYINIEVIYDPIARKMVHYNWSRANQSLMRW